MDRTEWLASLKPGDEVCVPQMYGYAAHIKTVKRLTATMIVLDDDTKYRKESGYQIGHRGWHSTSINMVTDAIRASVEHAELCQWLDSMSGRRKSLSIEMLRALKAAYDASQPAKEA